MASKKDLKKDIKFIYNYLLSETFAFMVLFPNVDEKKIEKIAEDLNSMYNDLIEKACNLNKENEGKKVKMAYNQVRKELVEKTDSIIEQIKSLIPAK